MDLTQLDRRRSIESHLSLCVRRLVTERERLAQRFAHDHGLSSTDFRALMYISESELVRRPLAAGGLRDLMNMSAGAATYVVDRLVSAGHVRRESDPADRRRVVLRHTDSGELTAREFFSAIEKRNSRALAEVPLDDLATAERVMCHLIDTIPQRARD